MTLASTRAQAATSGPKPGRGGANRCKRIPAGTRITAAEYAREAVARTNVVTY